jgi:hypothetical protein
MAASYRQNPVYQIRMALKDRLELPRFDYLGRQESPAMFWERVEAAGKLDQALALFDQLEAEHRQKARVRRETKKEFAERIEREGRREEVERVLGELLAGGLGERVAQERLVARFQPLDGSHTRPWVTPNPWETGRLFLHKEEEKKLLALVRDDKDMDPEVKRAKERVEAARDRRAERVALATARHRAQELKARPPSAGPRPFQYACDSCKRYGTASCNECKVAYNAWEAEQAEYDALVGAPHDAHPNDPRLPTDRSPWG